MAIDKDSAEYNLGLLRGHAIGSRNKDIIAAADVITGCFGDDEAAEEEEEESSDAPRTGAWAEDELADLQKHLDAGKDDDDIVDRLIKKYGRKKAYIMRKIEEVRNAAE